MSKLNQHKQYYTMSATIGGVRVFINVLSFENILWVHKNVSISGASGDQSLKNQLFRHKRFFIANIMAGHDFYM